MINLQMYSDWNYLRSYFTSLEKVNLCYLLLSLCVSC